jgi:glycosyltransferase involved in cell wall biosynthesis
MKIAFVYDVIYPYVKGGVEKRVWELAVRLTHRGHEVHLFGMKFWEGEDIISREGVFLHGVCRAQKIYSNSRRSIWQAVYFSLHLLFPILNEKFDIIDCQQFPYFSCFSSKLISKVRKTPLVITWHEVWGEYWYEYLGWKGFGGKITEHLVAGLTPHCLAVSLTTKNNLKSLGDHQQITIIPNGVDLQHIRLINPSDEPSDIIFVGRLIQEKHVDLLVRAFGILSSEQPDLRLLIIGEGPEQGAITKIIRGLSLESRIILRGFQDNHDKVIALMKSAKVFVNPSTREGFGITALEALACGIPVITVDHPANAIRDLITEKNGFICPLSEKDLADTIRIALQRYAEMKNDCIDSAATFDWQRITTDIERYYQSVIETHESTVFQNGPGK